MDYVTIDGENFVARRIMNKVVEDIHTAYKMKDFSRVDTASKQHQIDLDYLKSQNADLNGLISRQKAQILNATRVHNERAVEVASLKDRIAELEATNQNLRRCNDNQCDSILDLQRKNHELSQKPRKLTSVSTGNLKVGDDFVFANNRPGASKHTVYTKLGITGRLSSLVPPDCITYMRKDNRNVSYCSNNLDVFPYNS
jgi:hypothetical protein